MSLYQFLLELFFHQFAECLPLEDVQRHSCWFQMLSFFFGMIFFTFVKFHLHCFHGTHFSLENQVSIVFIVFFLSLEVGFGMAFVVLFPSLEDGFGMAFVMLFSSCKGRIVMVFIVLFSTCKDGIHMAFVVLFSIGKDGFSMAFIDPFLLSRMDSAWLL